MYALANQRPKILKGVGNSHAGRFPILRCRQFTAADGQIGVAHRGRLGWHSTSVVTHQITHVQNDIALLRPISAVRGARSSHLLKDLKAVGGRGRPRVIVNQHHARRLLSDRFPGDAFQTPIQ